MITPLSLYLHIPFCRTRCNYCAFTTYAGMEPLIAPYIQALADEIQAVGGARRMPVHTLYFGGGTPSLLAPEQLGQVFDALHRVFAIAPDAEISLEANPGTVTRDSLWALRAVGINRLSLGVQSTKARELALLGRRHTSSEAREALAWARGAGFDSISLDLIYGLPGQMLDDCQATIETALGWEPDHISLYALSVEEGTPLHHRIAQGEIPAPDPDAAADMYEWAGERLERAGLAQYEISNWAVPGHECRHNLTYWRNGDFLGFGAGAHGAAEGCRCWNVPGVEEYITRMARGKRHDFPFSPALEACERIDRPTAMAETVILGLRLVREGMKGSAFEGRFGCSLDEVYGPIIEELTALGLIERTAGGIRLTRRAYLVSNQVFVRFLPEDDDS